MQLPKKYQLYVKAIANYVSQLTDSPDEINSLDMNLKSMEIRKELEIPEELFLHLTIEDDDITIHLQCSTHQLNQLMFNYMTEYFNAVNENEESEVEFQHMTGVGQDTRPINDRVIDKLLDLNDE